MAKYFLDTSILVHYIRKSPLSIFIDNQYHPSDRQNYPVVSVVTLGEIYSLSFRLNWGVQKKELLNKILNTIPSVDINHPLIINKFAEIDAYRLGAHPDKPLPSGQSAKCIGDNDLWIASTAAVLKAVLLTTDKDFIVFDKIYLDVVYIDPEQFKAKS